MFIVIEMSFPDIFMHVSYISFFCLFFWAVESLFDSNSRRVTGGERRDGMQQRPMGANQTPGYKD